MKAPSGTYRGERNGFFRATGEFRPPIKGEYYLSGAIISAYQAPNTLGSSYWIAQQVPEPPRTIMAHGVRYVRQG